MIHCKKYLRVAIFNCIVAVLILVVNSHTVFAEKPAQIDYKKAMINLLANINNYAKAHNKNFAVIGNGALALYQYPQEVSKEDGKRMIDTIGAVLLESTHYSWDTNSPERTPEEVSRDLLPYLVKARQNNIPILNIDYCISIDKIVKAYKYNKTSNFISFVTTRELDSIPVFPIKLPDENTKDIRTLKQVRNFLALLNPSKFADKEQYLRSLQATNYDLLIIDLYFNDKVLSKEDISRLKIKKNGSKRLVYAYMSIGEAADYRKYWQKNWNIAKPEWIAEQNPNWPGSYKVQYWQKSWQELLFGSSGAYLDNILTAGFDGAFLDVIDAFYYFMEKENVT